MVSASASDAQIDLDRAAHAIIEAASWPQSDVKRLRQEIGDGLVICILGSTAFRGKETENFVKTLASELSNSLGTRVAFVTGGLAGVQQVFAENCQETSRVWNVLPLGERSGFSRGTDLHAGSDMQQRREVFGTLGDVYLTIGGGPGVSEEARAAAERGAAIIPFIRTGGASSGMFDFPSSALSKPWYATEEQWSLLADQQASHSKVASACSQLILSFEAHRGAFEDGDCDELCYADPDSDRWTQFAEMGNQLAVPDVKRGNMRLQGTFTGLATTHTYQLDVAVGLDVEMPSSVAASALNGSSSITGSAEGPKKSMFQMLADYFKKDAEVAKQPDLPALIMSGMQLKLDEVEAIYKQERDDLAHKLEDSNEKAISLESQLSSLKQERSELLLRLNSLEKEASCEAGTKQHEANTEGATSLLAKLSEREAEVRELSVQLQSASKEIERKRTEILDLQNKQELCNQQFQALKQALDEEKLQRELSEARHREALKNTEVVFAKLDQLQKAYNEIKVRSAYLEAEASKLLPPPEISKEMFSEEKHRAETLDALCNDLRRQLSDASAALAAGAVASAAATAEETAMTARVTLLEERLAELAGREARAKALEAEANRNLIEAVKEVERLSKESRELRETLAKVTASERRLAAMATELNSRLVDPPAGRRRHSADGKLSAKSRTPRQEMTASQESNSELQKAYDELLAAHQELQASYEHAQRCLDDMQGERASSQDDVQRWKQQGEKMGNELEKAKTVLAESIASKAAVEATLEAEKATNERWRKAFDEHKEQIKELSWKSTKYDLEVPKNKELERQLELAKQQLPDYQSLREELEQLRAEAETAGEARMADELRSQQLKAAQASKDATTKVQIMTMLEVKELQTRIRDLENLIAAGPSAPSMGVGLQANDVSPIQTGVFTPTRSGTPIARRTVAYPASGPHLSSSIAYDHIGGNYNSGAYITTRPRTAAYGSMTLPLSGNQVTRGKVTHIGTTTTIKVEGVPISSVHTPVATAADILPTMLRTMSGPLQTMPFRDAQMPFASSVVIPATPFLNAPVISATVPTTAGPINARMQVQVRGVRRIQR